jgi:hypothetical protein
MGTSRDNDLRIEAMGVAAVEGLAVREGLSVARPVWDADGIDLLVYRAKPTGAVKARGVQVKAYSGPAFVVYSKYADATVMAYYVNAASDDPTNPPVMYVMTARDARALAVAYTTAHARKPSSVYSPSKWDTYRWPSLSRDLRAALEPHRVGAGTTRTLSSVCRV